MLNFIIMLIAYDLMKFTNFQQLGTMVVLLKIEIRYICHICIFWYRVHSLSFLLKTHMFSIFKIFYRTLERKPLKTNQPVMRRLKIPIWKFYWQLCKLVAYMCIYVFECAYLNCIMSCIVYASGL